MKARCLLLALALPACSTSGSDAAGGTDPGPPRVEIIGHSDLGARGMNAAIAIAGNFVYVGSRTDGAKHTDAGVLIVDASDPRDPKIAGQIGAPEEALQGMSSRELRAIADKNLLIVLNFACSTQIHRCSLNLTDFPKTGGAAETDNLRFYDISNPVSPKLISRFDFGSYPGHDATKPHEMFLWRDPKNMDRILLYVSTPVTPALSVYDISDPVNVHLLTTWDARKNAGLFDDLLNSNIHSVSVSDDGNVAYMSYLASGFFMVDTSDLAMGAAKPTIKVLTPMAARIDYVPPEPLGTHSAVPVPGRDVVFLTDEVYPPPVGAGCPWGWARLVDVSDPTKPSLSGEYRVAENHAENCPDMMGGPLQTTFTAHNPTLTEHLAFVTWHSGGLQVIDTTDPAAAKQLVELKPEPLSMVTLEDPMFQGNPVEMWSYPVIQDGLVYVVDVRNGLYILKYTGPHQEEVATRHFLEGNSNLH